MSSVKPECSLLNTIRQNDFYTIDETTLLQQIQEAFSPELERLKNAIAVERGSSPPVDGDGTNLGLSPSEILYNKNFDEVNRTLIGVLALRWIKNNDYMRFTCGQPTAVRLKNESFQWLQTLFDKSLQTHDDLIALVISMVINDLGKDPDLEEDYYHQTHKRLMDLNHDSILLEAAKANMVPCLDMLDEEHRRFVMLGLELGSELNAGQLAQAESLPVNLEGLLLMRGQEHAFELKFLEQILDVAGAKGHKDPRCAANLIEPVFDSFKTVHEVSLDIISGQSTLRQGYDKVLTKRGNMLAREGFRRLSVSDDEQRALLRLLTMGRTDNLSQAKLFAKAFHAVDPRHKDVLIKGLNIDGNDNETAVLPYYMPAMISETLETTKGSDYETKRKALTSLMRYLARVLERSSSTDTETPTQSVPGIVIEHNMTKAQEVIKSEGFRNNPDKLDDLDIPQGQVLQRRRTSHSIAASASWESACTGSSAVTGSESYLFPTSNNFNAVKYD